MIVFKRNAWVADGVTTHFTMEAVCVGELTLFVDNKEWTSGFLINGDTLIFDAPPVPLTGIKLIYEVDYTAQQPREFNGGISYEGDL